MKMLDTNICVFILKKKPKQVLERLSAVPMDDVVVSTITLGELRHGVEKSEAKDKGKKEQRLSRFLSHVQVLCWNDDAAREYGSIRVELERAGSVIGNMDMLIAAHARSLSATLVTHKVKEFARVSGLMWEDWV